LNVFRPHTLEELFRIRREVRGTLFSGGTDVQVKIRSGSLSPTALIDTKEIRTEKIVKNDGILLIRMNTTYSDMLSFDLHEFPILQKIIPTIGSTQIRNRGTPLGNVCNASPAGDFLLSCYLYDASIRLLPTERVVKVEEFIKGPGNIALEPYEVAYELQFPVMNNYLCFFEKVGKRNSMNIATVSAGILLKLERCIVKDIRIALGSVCPNVFRSTELEKKIIGSRFELPVFKEIAQEYSNAVSPISDVRATADYRRKLVRNLLIKAYFELGGENDVQGS